MNRPQEQALSASELTILQHSLGADRYGRLKGERNHYVAGGADAALCRGLVGQALMTEHPATALTGGSPWFQVTPAGRTRMQAESPAVPKLTRAQQRYRDYLAADSHESFGQWLQRGRWRQAA